MRRSVKVRKERAIKRQQERKNRSTKEQLDVLSKRPGKSKKETDRLNENNNI